METLMHTNIYIYIHINKTANSTFLSEQHFMMSVANISVPKFQKILCYIVSQDGTMDMIGHSSNKKITNTIHIILDCMNEFKTIDNYHYF